MYELKKIEDDFIVNEINNNIKLNDSGRYAIFKLKKKGSNTEYIVNYLCNRFRINRKDISYSGSKDRRAITTQFISICNSRLPKLVEEDNFILTYIGQSEESLSLGNLDGNEFEITLRNLTIDEANNFKKTCKDIGNTCFAINYFDSQRFSTNNIKIGKLILQKKNKEAAKLVSESRKEEYNSNNPISYLQTIPQKIMLFYIHAFQSKLWNDIVSEYIHDSKEDNVCQEYDFGKLCFLKNINDLKSCSNKEIPLVGFDRDILKEFSLKYNKLLSKEKMTYRSFIIRSFPYLSCEGGFRPLCMKVDKINVNELEEDELNKYNNENSLDDNINKNKEKKYKIKISFELGKGSYATMFIKQLWNLSKIV